jgi:DNA-binding IscR family transcriptional regulator
VHDPVLPEQIAGSVNTSPVVIRSLLGELREAGLAGSRRGAGAGWTLTRELESITLLDAGEAVEPSATLFAMHRATPDQECPVGFGIGPAMRSIYDGIEGTIRDELARVTLAGVLRDVLAAAR